MADSENHLLRVLDLDAQTVSTVAGTGRLGYARVGGTARRTPLNSPWDLAWTGDTLYIAMAGRHQVWAYDPAADTVAPWAGTGREALRDGSLADSDLAQPCGLATDGTELVIACSEAQAIRSTTLGSGVLRTLVGTGLFDFGDRDGRGDTVRLQHPFGVALHGGLVYVADTYNSKIKRLDPRSRAVSAWLGGEARGDADGPAAEARFNEPEGLSVAADRLYIADTNNHAIRTVDLTDPAGQVSTLELRGLA